MVATTTGPESSELESRKVPEETADDRRIQKALDMTDGEWEILRSAATSRNMTPPDALKMAIRMAYGDPINSPSEEPDKA